MFENISVDELKQLDNINLIDIRSIEKYNSGHIKNAINISAQQLITNSNQYLNKNIKYYIYCQKGIQSRKICQILTNNEYKVVNVNGGYESWIINE